MAEKPNEEANSQSSQLAREEDLQKNNACSSFIAGGEVKVKSCLRRAKPAQFSTCTINF